MKNLKFTPSQLSLDSSWYVWLFHKFLFKDYELFFGEELTLFYQKHTKGYVSERILGSKSNSKPLSTYLKCLTMAVARTQRHYCNKCHLKRPECICKKQ